MGHFLLFRIFYTLGIYLLGIGIAILSGFNSKATLWRKGRKNWYSHLQTQTQNLGEYPDRFWVHCASLGEFEMVVPILEKLKEKVDGKLLIIVSFFSASGFEMRKNHPLPDLICYLPLDTPSNAKKFIQLVRPTLCVLVKYEFWLHYIDQLYKNNIPVFVTGARMTDKDIYFNGLRVLYIPFFRKISGWFVQDNVTAEILKDHDCGPVYVCGDTRIDRTLQLIKKKKTFDAVEKFVDKNPCLIIGSSWPEDEKVVLKNPELLIQKYKLIIAPHEIKEAHLAGLEHIFKGKAIRFSELGNTEQPEVFKVLLIDNIGILAHLYYYAHVAYIGGAFGKGLHNIIEPIAHRLPVIFGPKFSRFPEAMECIQKGIAISIGNHRECMGAIDDFMDLYGNVKLVKSIDEFLENSTGASDKIANLLSKTIRDSD